MDSPNTHKLKSLTESSLLLLQTVCKLPEKRELMLHQVEQRSYQIG
jgi:hypothetical protein